MNLKEKKQKLAEIKKEFEYGMFQNGKVENIGTVFFLYYPGASVLRDVVYYRSLHYGLDFETLSMTSSYFVGSKDHAEALYQALGGKMYPTEYCGSTTKGRELYAWEGPKRQQQCEEVHSYGFTEPLDIEEIKTILF